MALLFVTYSAAQTPVILSPVPKLQFFDASGKPLAFGCVFSYATLSSTPLATYNDYSGAVQNANPLILTAGGYVGTGGVWLQAGLAYRLVVKAAGGTNCASGSTISTVDGIGGGTTTLTTVVTYSATPVFVDAAQNQLFEITLTGNASSQPLTAAGIVPPGLITWQITQDNVGNHTFSWPANVTGGCTIASAANSVTLQHFIWNGSTAIATGPCVTGNGPSINAGAITADSFRSSAPSISSIGTVRLSTGGSLCFRDDANANDLCLTHGLVTDDLLWPNALRLGGSSTPLASTDQSGTGTLCMTTNCHLTTPALNGVTISGTPAAGEVLTATSSSAASWGGTPVIPGIVRSSSITGISGDTTIGSGADGTWVTKAVTMPAAGCPCRAFVSYGAFYTSTNAGAFESWIDDGTNQFATSQGNQTGANGTGSGLSASSYSTGTYANGANVTFSGKAHPTSAGGMTVTANARPGPQTSWLNVVIFTSN